jgi:PAS domain S-box-containing protein
MAVKLGEGMAMLSRKGRPETQGWLRRNTYLLLGASVWSVIVGAALGMNLRLDQHSMVEFALAEARMASEALTLISPSLIARQTHNLGRSGNGIRGHITSLNSVSPKNRPDDWERNALKRLAAGAAETSEVRDIDGRGYLSLMRSLVIEQNCLQCHAGQGYRVGDTRGGLSVNVPMAPIRDAHRSHVRTELAGYGMVWLMGLGALALTTRVLQRRAPEGEESEAVFRDLFENAPVAYHEIDREGMIRRVNRAECVLLGFEAGEMVGRPIWEFVAGTDQEDSREAIRWKLSGAQPLVPAQRRYVRRDGGELLLEIHDSLVRNATGETAGIRTALLDITERKRAEEVLAFLAQTSSGTADEPFFNALARYLAESLRMDFVCIDRLEGDEWTARTVAVWCDGHFEDNVTYALKDTPCGDVVGKTICCFPKDVRHLFPQDAVLQELRAESYVGTTLWSFDGKPIGLIAVIGRRPLVNPQLAESVLQLVAVRAAGELERKQAEERLRASEASYRLIADNTGDVIWTLDVASGRITYISPSVRRLRGYSPEEVLAQSLEGMLTPESDRRALTLLTERIAALEGGDESARVTLAELEHTCKDGSIVTTETVATLLSDELGHVTGVVGVSRDITERKRAEAALRESKERYRELFENSPLGIYRTTPDGRILLANPAWLTMLGCTSLEEFAEQNLDEECFEAGYDRGWFKHILERDGTIRNHEARWKRRDGSTVYLRENAKVVHDSNGAILYYDGTVEDITARKRIADALRNSEARFRQVAEDAGVFVWEVDAEGLYTYASPVVETILGYTPDELIGKLHYYDLFAPDSREKLKAIVTEAFAQRRLFSSFLNENVRKDGMIVILETGATPLLDAAGTLVGYRGANRDVTDRARATEELRRHRDHLEELVKERTAELEEKHSKLADEILERTLAVEAYRQSQARLQLQFDCMPVACITLGSDSRIRSWNPAAERIFGYSTTEAVGAPIVDLLVPEDVRSELGPFLQQVLEATETVHKVNDNVTKDGRRITCDPAGIARGILCMVQDITSRKQTEEALKRNTEELEAFNKAMIGREGRVIELKEEINRLCAELGRPPAYPPVWSGDKQ